MKKPIYAVLAGCAAALCLVCSQPTQIEYGTLVVGIHWDTVSKASTAAGSVSSGPSVAAGSPQTVRNPEKAARTADSLSVSEIRFTLQPGGLVFKFETLQETYTLQAELGIYNLSVEVIDDNGKTVYTGFYDEILIEPNKTREIQLTLEVKFPLEAPEFVGLTPVNLSEDGSYALRWSSVRVAETYSLHEDNDSTFTSAAVVYEGPDTVYAASDRQDGKYYYRVRAGSAVGTSPWSETVSFLVVRPSALILKTDSLPDGAEGSVYSALISAEGGTAPYTWSVSSGTLPSGLSINPATGVISGTPSSAGTFNFTVRIEDNGSPKQTASMQFSIAVSAVAPALSITTTSLSSGIVGEAYSQAVNATGGTAPYSWSVSAGTLPSGLSINPSTGAISGTPSSAGTFNFTVRVEDNGSPKQTASKQFSFTVSAVTPPLSITTTSLSSGMVGEGYSQAVSATGGTAPYFWSVSSGTPPTGLSINPSTGAIGGTPSSAGTFNFTVQVKDNGDPQQTATKDLSITIDPATLSITTTSLAAGQVDQPYNQAVNATGGTAPYSWSVSSGTWPPGLSINPSTGAISGTPSSAGTFNFTVQVDDNGDPQRTATKDLSIAIDPSNLSITTTSLAAGQVDQPYSQAVNATGGTAPYSWSVSSGTLPSGLSINPSTGVIDGTPSAAGTFNFTVRAADNGGPQQTATKDLSITIDPATLSITTPSLPSGQAGQAYSQAVSATGGTAPYSWSVSSGTLPPGLFINPSTGVIGGTPSSAGTFNFTVLAADNGDPQQTASRELSVTITIPLLQITTAYLPNATAGTAYNKQLNASGGTPPYSWTEISRNPAYTAEGINFNSGGLLSGTTYTDPHSGQITLRVTDSGASPQTATRTFNLTVVPGNLELFNAYLPEGEVDVIYWGYITYRLGTSPLQSPWTITGTLPPGLIVGYEAGNYQMTLSGPPNTSGTFNFSVTVYDSGSPQKTRTDSFSITIIP